MLKKLKRKIARFLVRNSSAILTYHGVSGSDLLFDNGIQIKKSLFEDHVRYLSQNYNCLKLSDLLDEIRNGKRCFKCVSITFDDGYANNFTNAFPVLQHCGVPATIFLTAGFVNTTDILWYDRIACILTSSDRTQIEIMGEVFPLQNKREVQAAYRKIVGSFKAYPLSEISEHTGQLSSQLEVNGTAIHAEGAFEEYRILNWEEIEKMQHSGLVEFGSHTMNHSILSRLSLEKARQEILQSKEILQRYLASAKLFSYPNGTINDFNEQHKEALRSLGFKGAVTTIQGRVSRMSDRYQLQRYYIESNCSASMLDYMISGKTEIAQVNSVYRLIRAAILGHFN